MNLPKDNLDSSYKTIKDHPTKLNQTLGKFNIYTERTYAAFKDVVGKHEYMGKAAIVIMARNMATHLIDTARNQESPYKETVYSVTATIAPMFQMMYDRLTEETIESLLENANKEN